MLHVGYNTPYRIILLLLIKKFCQYQLSEFITYKFILFLTKSVLNESRCEETCSEPTLRQVIATIETFSDDGNIITYTIEDIVNDINALRRPERLENFLKSITSLLDNEAEVQSQDHILLQKECVFGLFIRKCHVEFESMPDDRFYDLFRAFEMYCSHQAGDNIFANQQEERWISEHNIVTFLKAQAEMIEKTGQSSIHPTVMHNYLRELEQCIPDVPYIHQMKYLNYALSKEHVQSLYHLHIYFDSSVNQGVEIQYALLNLGILEYKFGHFSDALFAFNDALTAARKNKDEYCLQEIQYWIETCRKNHYFQGSSSFTDDYLNNMKALTLARDMICRGDSNRHVFKILYKTSINIIMKDIEQMDRVQYLITALAWLRCGNSTLVSSYLELAKNVKDSRIEDIEKTVLLNAKMLELAGESEMAIDLIDMFTRQYPKESVLLMDWKMTRANLLKQTSNRKRKYLDIQSGLLYSTLGPNSDEYLNGVYKNVQTLVDNREFESALGILDRIQDQIQKRDNASGLDTVLVMKAETYIQMGYHNGAIPILQKAMTQSKLAYNTRNFYIAVIKLVRIYIRSKNAELKRKAILMLERVFPKVLLMKSKDLELDLRRTYAEATSQ